LSEPTADGTAAKERIGRYEIVEKLGRGAMGVIYHAYDPMLDRDVALKVMAPQIADDPDQKARFEREARAVARIVHPNVLTVFDLGYHHDGSPYIAMELLKGKDLLKTMRHDPPLLLERKVSVILQVLEGLAQAHQAGVVHRDIKPANIFLTVDGTVKIMDFGVARFTKANVTGTGSIMGTADYMSPEQVQGAKVDGRSDLWSTGCMLYELLGSRRPFSGESLMTVFYKITHDEPDVLALPEGRVYALLRGIVATALAKDADQRYQTAPEFAAALRACLSETSTVAAAAPAATSPPGSSARRHDPDPNTLDLGAVAAAAVTPPGDAAAAPPPPAAAAPAPAASPAVSRPAVPVAPAPPPAAPARAVDPMPLFRLIREVFVNSRSGHLHFTHGKERRSLFFLRGHIVHGTTDVEGEHLGQILVRYGLLSQPDLERATAIVLSERKRLGTVLDDLGIMTKDRLEEAVGLHVREILFSVAGRGDGSYSFEEMGEEGAASANLTAQIPPGQVILEAARRLQSPEMMAQVLGDIDRVLAHSSNSLLRVQKLTLSPADGFVLSRVDGTLTARELFQIIPLSQEDAEHSLFGLLCTGTLEFVPRTATSRARAAVEGERVSAAPPASAPPAARPPAPRAPPPAPPVAAAAAPAAPARRAEADQQREDVRKAVEARRREIVDAYEGIKARDFFEFLGVSRDADERGVKEAYFRLAKPFHPDTALDPSLSDLRSKREAVFLHLGQVYETLRNPANRARYERMLNARAPRRPDAAPASATTPPAPAPAAAPDEDKAQQLEAAVEAVRTGMRLVKEGKYWDAIRAIEPALPKLEGTVKLRARVTLARAYAKNPNWLRRAEEALLTVLQESPEYAEALVVLGQVYRASDQPARAVAMYRKALDLQPGNEEAVAELAALEPRSADPGSGKLLKKLFGK
jgi:tetratricopeptide (TPR) repeat protein